MDKHKNFEILLEQSGLVKYFNEVIGMAEKTTYKGQQITFPMRFFNPARIQRIIIQEYDGTNIKALDIKYNYSEKTVRRIIRDSVEEN